MKKFKNLILGLVLIVVGAILGLNATGVVDVNLFFDGWWTLFIIIPSFIDLFNEKDKTGNVIGLLIGIVLLLVCQGILDLNLVWKLIFPTVLVIIGVSFVFKDTFNKQVNDNINKLNKENKNKNEYCATFSGQTANFDGEKFERTDLTAVFGGVECDLRKAIIEKEAIINTSSIFGGIDIYVPEDVKVKIKSSAIFGGVSDERKNKKIEEASKTIYVNATCLFGGVEIK